MLVPNRSTKIWAERAPQSAVTILRVLLVTHRDDLSHFRACLPSNAVEKIQLDKTLASLTYAAASLTMLESGHVPNPKQVKKILDLVDMNVREALEWRKTHKACDQLAPKLRKAWDALLTERTIMPSPSQAPGF